MIATGFKHTRIGRSVTHMAVSTLEYLKIAPEGTTRVSQMLCETADDLVEGTPRTHCTWRAHTNINPDIFILNLGGKKDVFTPMHFFLARKPLAKDE
jgi:sterol 24-C-methyltransferase